MLLACTLPVRRSTIVVPPYGCQTPAMLLPTALPEPFTPGPPAALTLSHPAARVQSRYTTLSLAVGRSGGPLAARGGRCERRGRGVAAGGGRGVARSHSAGAKMPVFFLSMPRQSPSPAAPERSQRPYAVVYCHARLSTTSS